jgi:hypothetical protein
VLTLGILALVTLLLIAFVTSMRVENMAAKNFNDMIKARQLAQAAVDQAVTTIRQATTPMRTPSPAFTYVTFPGIVATNFQGVTGFIRLYSVSPTATHDLLDLNSGFGITGTNTVEFPPPTDPPITVEWIYIGRDPTLPPGPNNPIVGRFAYWVDDEASKVNINQAWARPHAGTPPIPDTTYAYNDAYGDTSEVDLNALVPALNAYANQIEAARATPLPPYATIEEVRRATPPPPAPGIVYADFNANQFYLTTLSDDTGDLDVFGRQRLILSPLAANGLSQSKDIVDTTGPNSAYARLSDPNLMKVYTPPPGSSINAFADTAKYGVNGLQQIIANIIAYQQDPIVTPPPDDGNTPPNYLGLGKTPYINEAQVRYDVALDLSTGNTNVTQIVSVELFYMYNGTYTPAPDAVTIPAITVPEPALPTGPFTFPVPATPAFSSGSIYYYSITNGPVQVTTWPEPIPAQTIDITYSRPYSGGPKRLDFARVPLPAGATLNAVPMSSFQGAEANDPAVNDGVSTANQWTPYTTPGTLGAQNNAYNQTADPTLSLKALPSKAVMRGLPMQSIGELGFIHTPAQWTYLRLQPQTDKPSIPDWAMLDMFTVGGPTAGRVNINSFISQLPVATRRLYPLEALLNGAAASPAAVAANIYLNNYVNPMASTPPDTFGYNGAYDTIGEICEVQGMDNSASTEAGREAIIRRIGNLLTTRSNAFTIWAIAQSIKDISNIGTYDPPSAGGKDFITGEVKVQAVVERYEQAGVLRFRTKYFRYYYQ